MKRELNTDKIIREKLEDFSVVPPAHIWDNVQSTLAAQKQRKRMAFIGWISAAAVILLAFIGGWYFNESQNAGKVATVQNENITDDNKTTETINNSTQEKAALAELEIIKTEKQKTETINEVAERTKNKSASVTRKAKEKPVVIENDFGRAVIAMSEMESAEATVYFIEHDNKKLAEKSNSISKPNSFELSESERRLIAMNVQNAKEIKENDERSWKMGMNISPGYASHAASHSEDYAQSMTYSGDNGNANLSGGLSVQYKTNKRWSIESGAYYARNGQKSEPSFNLFAMNDRKDYAAAVPSGDAYFSNTVKVSNGTMEMNSTAGVIALSETPKGAEIASELDASNALTSGSLISSGEFSQVFEFVEIPLLVRYRVVDQKFGVDIIGGFNAGIVVGNDAYIDNEYGLQNVGTTEDISPLNISGTVGVGVNYLLSKHFSFAFEPRFNYYLNSINNNPDVDFRPYRIGFFTGVYYEF
ncbi:MAG: outer membrane beta-barrel protein [Draconibacterium sp.]